jgi:hypothetical protein
MGTAQNQIPDSAGSVAGNIAVSVDMSQASSSTIVHDIHGYHKSLWKVV